MNRLSCGDRAKKAGERSGGRGGIGRKRPGEKLGEERDRAKKAPS